MTDWPPWALVGEPLALARYVLPDHVARYVQLPGPSGESRLRRLRTVYAGLAELKIGYAYDDDAAGAEAGRQVIRPPEQVLWAPRHATCLDLAVVLAAACLKAGLHPVIVILDPPDGHGAGHSLVLVRLDRGRRARTDGASGQDVWDEPPAGLLDSLQRELGGPPGKVLAVDPVGVAVSLGATATRGLGVSLAAAVAAGARYLTGGDGRVAWRWRLGVDVGSAWSQQATQRPDPRPEVEPLREPYRSADSAESPLRLLRAEYELVPFQNRDELTVLADWCRRVAAGDRTGLAVITGIGGSGKTRLALQLAHVLRREGWYAGVLPKGTQGAGWLAEVVSPLLVVLDYADGRTADAKALLKALRAHRGSPAVVLCTARSIDGDWLADIVASLDDDRHAFRREQVTLPDAHPDSLDVYQRTVAALTSPAAAVEAPRPPRGIRWTTLDFVLLGWVTAQGNPALPTTRGALYDQVLVHEQSYWCTVYRDHVAERRPSRARLRQAAACLCLVAPTEREADRVLRAVADLAEDARERHDVRDTLVVCLRPGPGEGLAVRPDPVGDHLLLRELDQDPGLVARTLGQAGEARLGQALITLVRAGQNDAEASTRLITGLLTHDPDRWPAVLSVAGRQGGAATASLERLAAQPDTRLPLDELSAAVPFSAIALYDLGLLVDRRRLDTARTTDAGPETLANLLARVSFRAGHTGDRAGALAAIAEAVEIYRGLAKDPAFLRWLAILLDGLSFRQAQVGDWAGGLATNTEAVEIYRRLAKDAALLPGLAESLNNLSLRQAEAGDRAGALATITEAVNIRRGLAKDTAFLPALAGSLNNLSKAQGETGDRAGALATITEAVESYRKLAETNPAVFLPGLAGSLNNLSLRQGEVGDRAGALTTITEAVGYHRGLAQAHSAAFLPHLAVSLNNLSLQQAGVGDRAGALTTVTEAVEIYRNLVQENPAAFLPHLAVSLNNLSLQQAGVGDRAGALTTVTEAVEIYRNLVQENSAAWLPDLAVSLINLSKAQREAR